jgi:predicted PurR-regulated permease PerM
VTDGLRNWAGTTWRLLIVLAGVAVLWLGLGLIAPVVFAIFFAMLFSALASPLMRVFRRALPKALSMILAILVIAIGVIGILTVVIVSVVREGPNIVTAVQNGIKDLQDWLQNGPFKLDDQALASFMGQLSEWGKQIGEALLLDVAGTASSIGTLVVAGSVFIFGVIFFMGNPESIWRWVVSWFPPKSREMVDTSGRIAWDSISGYTRGIVIVALCDALLVYIGLVILGVPLAPALAAVVFLGAFIPVIGAPVATFFAAIVALAERGFVVALLTVVLTIIVGSFDGDVLQPLVMGKAVNIHPLAIVVLIAAGALTLGIVGALIAVPLGAAAYGVAKYISGRDPEHPRPTAWGAPGVDPDQPPFPAPKPKRSLRDRFRRRTATAVP